MKVLWLLSLCIVLVTAPMEGYGYFDTGLCDALRRLESENTTQVVVEMSVGVDQCGAGELELLLDYHRMETGPGVTWEIEEFEQVLERRERIAHPYCFQQQGGGSYCFPAELPTTPFSVNVVRTRVVITRIGQAMRLSCTPSHVCASGDSAYCCGWSFCGENAFGWNHRTSCSILKERRPGCKVSVREWWD